jgi:hypothetical protein
MYNRYEDIPFFYVKDTDGNIRALHEAMIPARDVDTSFKNAQLVHVNANIALDLVAAEYLGDSHKWKAIAEVNWPLVEDPLECAEVDLFIPDSARF